MSLLRPKEREYDQARAEMGGAPWREVPKSTDAWYILDEEAAAMALPVERGRRRPMIVGAAVATVVALLALVTWAQRPRTTAAPATATAVVTPAQAPPVAAAATVAATPSVTTAPSVAPTPSVAPKPPVAPAPAAAAAPARPAHAKHHAAKHARR
jgi:hypothetical protein